MRTSCFISVIATVALLAGQPAGAQQDGTQQDSVRRAPPGSDEAYKKFRAQCEQTSCSPSGGDSCVQAAELLLSETPPDSFWQVNSDQRKKIAIRLLEKGVNNSNLARAYAYDIYSAFVLFGGFSDPIRAEELMEMMTASNYPGAALRKARRSVALFSNTSPEQRTAGCGLAKDMLSRGGLDADSQRIAKEIVEAGVCTPSEPPKN